MKRRGVRKAIIGGLVAVISPFIAGDGCYEPPTGTCEDKTPPINNSNHYAYEVASNGDINNTASRDLRGPRDYNLAAYDGLGEIVAYTQQSSFSRVGMFGFRGDQGFRISVAPVSRPTCLKVINPGEFAKMIDLHEYIVDYNRMRTSYFEKSAGVVGVDIPVIGAPITNQMIYIEVSPWDSTDAVWIDYITFD